MLCWNVKGICSLASLRRLKKLVRLHNLSIVFLLEPVISNDTASRINWQLGFPNFMTASSGKIWVFWSSNFTLSFQHEIHQLLYFHYQHPSFLTHCSFTVVYGKCTVADLRLLRFSLLIIHSQLSGSQRLVCGDFNAILAMDESADQGTLDTCSMANFSTF